MSLPEEILDVIVEHVQERVETSTRWRNIEGTARAFGVTVRRVEDWREKGCPARKVGKPLFFNLDEVEAWLDQQERV